MTLEKNVGSPVKSTAQSAQYNVTQVGGSVESSFSEH